MDKVIFLRDYFYYLHTTSFSPGKFNNCTPAGSKNYHTGNFQDKSLSQSYTGLVFPRAWAKLPLILMADRHACKGEKPLISVVAHATFLTGKPFCMP